MDEEHKPVTIANVIAGEQTIATHCLACGHRGELDPRLLSVVEGHSTTMDGLAGVARNDKAAVLAAFQRFVQQALGFSRSGGSE
jgi:hypothetical protein